MTKEELKQKKLASILLGCDKNRVDLEHMLSKVKEYGIQITNDAESADIILVQTCAFILPAREEAIQNILYALSLKQLNPEIKVLVSGCFPQKNLKELKEEFPEVDYFITITSYPIITQILEEIYGVTVSKRKLDYDTNRLVTTPKHYAYLKIADGCNNCCSYCTIPRIRGRYKSVEQDLLLKEASKLADSGVKELIIVAQDITKYGEDLYGENKLIELLTKLSKIKKIKWIRLLYCYPEGITDSLLDFISQNDKICKYLDIPLQHIDDEILSSMNRRVGEQDTINLIEKIQNSYPTIKIRSTFIVGYPGETGSKFKKLKNFLLKYKLDFVGFFEYSREENTRAYYLKNQKFNFIKRHRRKILEKQQANIFIQNANKYLNNTYDAVIDDFDINKGVYICRTEHFAPEIDFFVEVDTYNTDYEIGSSVNIKITKFEDWIFKGEIYEHTK